AALGEDGSVYIASKDNNLYALSSGGALQWSYATGEMKVACAYSSSTLSSDGRVYLGSNDGNMYTFSTAGALMWSYGMGLGPAPSSPALDGCGTIYIGSRDTQLYALGSNGTLVWSYRTDAALYSSPAIGGGAGAVYFGAGSTYTSDYNIYALTSVGGLSWSYMAGESVDASPVIGNGGEIYVGSIDNRMYALSSVGALLWSYETGGSIMEACAAVDSAGSIYFGSEDRCLYCLASDGSLIWSYPSGEVIIDSSPALAVDKRLYMGLQNHMVCLVAGTLQFGNDNPVTPFVTKWSNGLTDNRICGCYDYDPPAQRADPLDVIYSTGVKWIHSNFWSSPPWYGPLNWKNVEETPATCATPGSYSIEMPEGAPTPDGTDGDAEAHVQEFFEGMQANNIDVVVSLSLGSCLPCDYSTPPSYWSYFTTEQEKCAFAGYATYISEQYCNDYGVKYYEILNEPDVDMDYGRISAADYVELVATVIPAIKTPCPDAKIVVGSIGGYWSYWSPQNSSRYCFHLEYLEDVIEGLGEELGNDFDSYVDGISWHPFFGTRPDDDYYRNYEEDTVGEIKALAWSYGFQGQYLATEIAWTTAGSAPDPSKSVSELVATKYLARAIVWHLSMDVIAGCQRPEGWCDGPICPWMSVVTNLCTVMAGAENASLDVEVVFEPPEPDYYKTYSFALPNGDLLVALWTDDVIEDDDDQTSGVKATVTIDGLAGRTVKCVDVLNGVEQEMVTGADGEDLVISDLWVKDYPLILVIQAIKNWPMFQHDARHTGRNVHTGPDEPYLLWSYETGGGIQSDPVICESGRIYFGSLDQNLYCLEPDGVTLAWSYSAGGWVR
ncbi:MAG: PQQ-binding-like beta-propeller repeat protein, partial [bacterium]